jgi:hypothetical protein
MWGAEVETMSRWSTEDFSVTDVTDVDTTKMPVKLHFWHVSDAKGSWERRRIESHSLRQIHSHQS